MDLVFTHRKSKDVPSPNRSGKVNQALTALMREMTKLAPDMVLEIETGDEKAIRATKAMITRAGKEFGTPWLHWHEGTRVFTRPSDPITERGRKQRSERANLRDNRN
jgi:ketosteroid isomerase-like protein